MDSPLSLPEEISPVGHSSPLSFPQEWGELPTFSRIFSLLWKEISEIPDFCGKRLGELRTRVQKIPYTLEYFIQILRKGEPI